MNVIVACRFVCSHHTGVTGAVLDMLLCYAVISRWQRQCSKVSEDLMQRPSMCQSHGIYRDVALPFLPASQLQMMHSSTLLQSLALPRAAITCMMLTSQHSTLCAVQVC